MTDNEFIKEKQKILKSMPDTICLTREEAKSILEELEQYRSIGTVEEIQEKMGKLQRWHDEHLEDITVDLAEYRDLCKLEEVEHMKTLKRIIQRNGTIGKALDECAEYEEIGTVEECREARERQRGKKVKKQNFT